MSVAKINLKIDNSTASSQNSRLVRVNLTNRGLRKVLKISDKTNNDEFLLALAEILSLLKIERGNPTGFSTIPECYGVHYVGYIIEKERLNNTTNEWQKIDEYKILGALASNFVDTRVAYGYYYRYRIRPIVKATKKVPKKNFSNADILRDLNVFLRSQINQNDSPEKNIVILDALDNLVSVGIEPKLGSGADQALNTATGNIVNITPRGSMSVQTVRPVVVEDLKILDDLSIDYSLIGTQIDAPELRTLLNKIITQYQQLAFEYKSFYFCGPPSKQWNYFKIEENRLPPPPSDIRIVPNTLNGTVTIYWLKPANDQRDIQYVRLYRRDKLGSPWALMGERSVIDKDFIDENEIQDSLINVTKNMYVDGNVEKGKPYIYAMTSVDVHGLESFMSVQIQTELNLNFALEKKEKPLKWISGSGLRPDEIDAVIKKFVDLEQPLIAKNNIVISPNTKFSETTKDLIIKVKSLDTHEVKEYKIKIVNKLLAGSGS